jgi:hypothetical protein
MGLDQVELVSSLTVTVDRSCLALVSNFLQYPHSPRDLTND